jgi:hypothetical protein
MSGTCTHSLEGQINELEVKVNTLEPVCQNKSQLLKARNEIAEWESWNCGISEMYRKARKTV